MLESHDIEHTTKYWYILSPTVLCRLPALPGSVHRPSFLGAKCFCVDRDLQEGEEKLHLTVIESA
jgi:hypothetical protein